VNKNIRIVPFTIALLIISFLTYISINKIIQYSLKAFNKTLALNQSKILLSSYNRRLESIEKINQDWAHWDDSYKFVQDQNDLFRNTNLVDETLKNANLNLILFFDKSGYLVFKKAVILEGIGGDSVPPEVTEYTLKDQKINIKDIISTGNQQSGFLHTTEGTFIYSVTPILTSEGQGPTMGALMMARYINSTDKLEILNNTGLDVDFIDAQNFDSNKHNINLDQLKSGTSITDKGDYYEIFTLVKDTFNNPSQVLRYRHDLLGTQESKTLVFYLTGVSVLLSLVFSALLKLFKVSR
jgi:sensor domain CHASE-containing protein